MSSQIWLLDEEALASRMAMENRPDSLAAELSVPAHEIIDGVAIVSVSGTFVPESSLMQVLRGDTSTEAFAGLMSDLAANADVSAVLLRMDSPGGFAKGIPAAAESVRQLATTKPVYAFTEGTMASAAYYVASQATKVFAASGSRVGSVGTRAVLYDVSKMFDDAGVKPVILDTGRFKSAGHPGTEITAEHREYFQQFVDAVQEPFTNAVRRGRGITDMSEVLTGKVFLASQAARLGLIDAIQTFDQTIASLRSVGTKQKETEMSQAENTPAPRQPASFADLKACLPGASSEFLCDALEKNWTLDQAQSSFMEQQDVERKQLAEKLQKLEAENAKLKQQQPPGVDPASLEEPEHQTDIGDARSEWESKIAEQVSRGLTRQQAVATVGKKYPELRAQLVALAN